MTKEIIVFFIKFYFLVFLNFLRAVILKYIMQGAFPESLKGIYLKKLRRFLEK